MQPFCGKYKNKLIDPNRIEIIDRGIISMLYFPQSEDSDKSFRRKYAVTVDLWNYDQFW